MIAFLQQPWPWYVAGPLIGLLVPALLLTGNKTFGISSNFRHICAACAPANISFFNYNWRKESWNLIFALGILAGGVVAAQWLGNGQPASIHPALAAELSLHGVHPEAAIVPSSLFGIDQIFTLRGLILMIGGGLLVGFGTRYAGGCTSGHSIMGLSSLQWPSLVATIAFMAGGFLMANLILPQILAL
ncbi:YeeE/YedE family protein [Chitinophaga rhizosphaerae]|uniref:YeeE/YedE family protein n=1 Tax=Chitinophaga rhizosphaerae TaxID=1864947 RepID=UPI000F7FAEBD|nr:YeeE/YedE thiosulfate transporter family protein [Chitinophaga rhizosphaerae]